MKTKKWLLRVLILFCVTLTGCGYAAPEKAVRQEMELIRKLDESTIKTFVSYEDIKFANSTSPEIGPETTDAIKLFFKNFKYRIRSSSVSDDNTTATVNLNITNIDAKALAKDLCCSIIENASANGSSPQQEGITSSFALMKKCLEENTYSLVTTEATVNLTNQNGEWVIPESNEFEDELTGGLVSCLQDPYLLTPQEVLECTLDPFSSFTAQQWHDYLCLNDVFTTGSSKATDIDMALCEQISAYFKYEIKEVTQDGENAEATVVITSLDLESVMTGCKDSLLEYAKTTESIRATDEEISQKTADLLLDALKNNDESAENTVTVSLVNNGYAWEVHPGEVFSSALLGGVDSAINQLQ
ncbi:MAG: DUF5105 domain-containing protein [Eubacteriales bacterium]|nr:DUF5105 domain-containing protein [Eubacteriales bacterium]